MLPEIGELGFVFSDELTILGFKVTNDFLTHTENFEQIISKIEKTAKFWGRLNLSLPGRINIYKTFMLSQVGYKGCILFPLEEQLSRMQIIMNKFVVGKLNISKYRLYIPPQQGGLGIISLDD